MHNKYKKGVSNGIFFVGTILMSTLFIVTLVRAVAFPSNPDEIDTGITPVALETSTPSPLTSNEKPSRLQIPSIGVDANIQHVGLGKSRNMAVPTNYTDVGWYRHGTIPGQSGAAVIDGHVDNGFALPAVFKNLHTLKAGDEIYILTEQGNRIKFKVISTTTYDYNDHEAAGTIFHDTSGKALLRLITCTGDWIKDSKTYERRIVITAELAT